ncbi:two-component response regulator-like PRR1 isoform X2 [Aristolochia californica]|uniref:two-component response regulator-like PRR1 isoform X2 n=1 Tax=Aristolochia californica TaxID=171875 RepID=UPI0035E21EAC
MSSFLMQSLYYVLKEVFGFDQAIMACNGGNNPLGRDTSKDFLDRSKVRILLCDNDAKNSQEIFQLLCKCSYQVTSVRTARQVIDALNAEGSEIDIILAEVDLPIAKGFKMLKYIMRDEELHRIPIIMMSSQDEVSVVIKCLRLGAADYLVKPLRTNELLNLWTHMWKRRRMLGLADKNILNYDFDGAGSDPSDANTNSTTLFSDDTDDMTRRSNIPETGASNHPESDSKSSRLTLLQNSLEYNPVVQTNNDLSETIGLPLGGIPSCPKKSELKVGESSAFFTYVKVNPTTRNKSPRLGCPEDNMSQTEEAHEKERLPMMHRQVTGVDKCQDKESWEYNISKKGVRCNNAAEVHSAENLCTPSVPLEGSFGWNISKEELHHTAQLQPGSELHQPDILGVPSLPTMPFYLPPMMRQIMMPPSTQSQGSIHNVPKHAASASLSQYNGVQLPQCAHVHMNMMGSFPYYHPVNIAMQPGQMRAAPPLGHSAMASSPSTELKSDQVERRERALIKFRQKRKGRCFTKQIRYASRKQLAERRPRLRGQFVRQVADGSILSLNGCSAADDDDSDTDEDVDENEDEASEF